MKIRCLIPSKTNIFKKNFFFPKLKVKNHPSMEDSFKHKNLKNKIEKYLNKNKTFFKNNKNNKNISYFLDLLHLLLNVWREEVELFIFAGS